MRAKCTPAESVLARQRHYAAEKKASARAGLAVPEAFVRGIRCLGYKSNVEAIAELIDNSIQAYAERVDVVFDYAPGGSTKKPSMLAVVDDGHGMDPSMLRLAVMWGGTHREDDRAGLGRFGYGLPCATVSIGRRFTVISKISNGSPHAVTLDLDALEAGEYLDDDGEITIPAPRPVTLPRFVAEHLASVRPVGWASGTIVLIEKLDRLNWTTSVGLRTRLLSHFGVTYHKLLAGTEIHIDGSRVRAVDPLFLEPDCDLHDLDDDRAQRLDGMTIAVPLEGGGSGTISLRYAWLPPSFGAVDKDRDATGLNANARFGILKHYHGVIFSRNGRLVDVASRTPWTTFVNNDRYIRIEVEFSASLDDLFGVTTSKQQVSVSTAGWDLLREAGFHKAIEQLRAKVRAAKLAKPRTPSSRDGAPCSDSRPALPEPPASAAREPITNNAGGNRSRIVGPLVTTTAVRDLEALLRCIERRSTSGGTLVAKEYRALISEWERGRRPR